MADAGRFDHFIAAQESIYKAVLAELGNGRKASHWMWFVFPQLRGLGRSGTAQFYGIDDLEAARAYLRHRTLGQRLIACTRLVNAIEGRTAREVFGSPDDLKFRSSMTLFGRADRTIREFPAALRKYYAGIEDPQTLELLGLG
ncbi:MAG: DUF1810 domain-containing protein [Devosia nanyangense]|uniref:DUF1810 domain-containing protein n=1 Tax=Devosia nanyangense TaxID=1228055 RepID=A0A933KZ93_9HYPH|nr:DUF1810 domain-containing protein [Devosia nanyangense]